MDIRLLCSWGLNSEEITSSLWDGSRALQSCWLCTGTAHTHTDTECWIVANGIRAWSNHFQIQWCHLCQVHRSSRKHTHTLREPLIQKVRQWSIFIFQLWHRCCFKVLQSYLFHWTQTGTILTSYGGFRLKGWGYNPHWTIKCPYKV